MFGSITVGESVTGWAHSESLRDRTQARFAATEEVSRGRVDVEPRNGNFCGNYGQLDQRPCEHFRIPAVFLALVQIVIKVPSRTRPRVTPPTYPRGPAPV